MPDITPKLVPDPLSSSKRIAVLVIHGIGQQRPYETLDQFARGLLESFRNDTKAPEWKIYPQLEICKDPSHAQQSWVRASYRIKPDTPVDFQSGFQTRGDSIEDISLFEYYWAPITQDKISYTSSLFFLIRAGLQPFLYMGANINAIWNTDRTRLFTVVVREIVRQACLFLPLILFLAATLGWLARVFTRFESNPASIIPAVERHQAPILILTAVLIFVRYLYAFTTGKALFQSLKADSGWQVNHLWRATMLAGFLFHIFFWPLYLSPALRFIANRCSDLARYLPSLPQHLGHWSHVLRNIAAHTAFPQAGAPFMLRLKSLVFLDPAFSSYLPILFWLLLAMLVRFILISYVGDVAVYVNANELAKNFAAHSQILDECTTTLTCILKEGCGAGADSATFDQVFVAGHSLGSVIAYDTINALLNRARTESTDPNQIRAADLGRLRGLATFGSPLNKTYYFFREQNDPRQALRGQTLDLLHGFRLLPNLQESAKEWRFEPVTDTGWVLADWQLSHNFRWINAYSIEDPVSGRLLFYDLGDQNNQQGFNLYMPFIAHLSYWQDSNFYKFVRSRLF